VCGVGESCLSKRFRNGEINSCCGELYTRWKIGLDVKIVSIGVGTRKKEIKNAPCHYWCYDGMMREKNGLMKLNPQKEWLFCALSGLNMSKTNVKKPKFHGRADKFWINKVRLYLALHGLTIYNWVGNCHRCKYVVKLSGCPGSAHNYRCKKLFHEQRWFIKPDLSGIKRGNNCSRFGYFCMEWITNV